MVGDVTRIQTEGATREGCIPAGATSLSMLLLGALVADMHHCPNCGGGELTIIAAILEQPLIEKILTHRG